MSSCDKSATDPMDNYLSNRLKYWATRVQPRPIVKRLLLEAASESRSGGSKQGNMPISPIARGFRALSVSLIDRLTSQGLPAEMLRVVGEDHPTRGRFERDIVLHSFPTGMGIYLLMA
jgi:hypothetical protein